MTKPTDAELLSAWQADDASAFAELVQRYQGPLLRHARGVLVSVGSAEDVVQEVFLQLARTRGGQPLWGTGRPLSAWLHRVTRNLCMDVIRAERRRKRRERQAAGSEATTGGLQVVEAQDTQARIEQELAKLPVEQREVLVLRLLAERSYREIAEITGKKIGTVGWLVSVGLKALSQELEPLLSGANKKRPDVVTEPGLGFGMVQGELS